MKNVLVTGASGFVGRGLVAELASLGYALRAAMRQPADVFPRSVEVVAVSDLTRPVEWRVALLKGMDTVVHAAEASPMPARPSPTSSMTRVNRLATAELANAAPRRDVTPSRFRQHRTRSALRAATTSETVLREIDTPQPTDAYGRSKLTQPRKPCAAHQACPTPFSAPLLIYGAGVKGNLARPD